MHGLQAELQPDMMFIGITLQKLNHRIRDTIGTRPHRKPDNILLRQSLIIKIPQALHWAICVCKRLKISDELHSQTVFTVIALSLRNLFRNGRQGSRLAQS